MAKGMLHVRLMKIEIIAVAITTVFMDILIVNPFFDEVVFL